MKLPPGQSFMQVHALTPMTIAADHGDQVDRRLMLDSWTRLPCIPDSILKGVIAASCTQAHRGNRFGRPEDDHDAAVRVSPGLRSASKIVFGEGRLLSFPVRLNSGQLVVVVPASTLSWQSSLPLGKELKLDLGLSRLADDACFAQGIETEDLPVQTTILAPPDYVSVLRDALAIDEPILVAGRMSARQLFDLAQQRITLTALDQDRQVRHGSLRSIELLPAGSRFLVWVSSLENDVRRVDQSRLQFGGHEGIGLGFCCLHALEFRRSNRDASIRPDASQPTQAHREMISTGGLDRLRLLQQLRKFNFAHEELEALVQQLRNTLLNEQAHGSAWALLNFLPVLRSNRKTRDLLQQETGITDLCGWITTGLRKESSSGSALFQVLGALQAVAELLVTEWS